MSFALYLVGFAIFLAGIAWTLVVAGVPSLYVTIATFIAFGAGLIAGVTRAGD